MYRYYKGHHTDDELDEEELAEIAEVKKVVLPVQVVEAIYTTIETPTEDYAFDCRERIIERLKDAVYFRKELYLAFLGLTSEDVANIVVPFLKIYSDIPKLNISSNNIGDEGLKALITISTLKEIDICSNGISVNGAQFLEKIKTQKLDISFNSIGDEGVTALARNDNIKLLNIYSNKGVTTQGLSQLIFNLTLMQLQYTNPTQIDYKEIDDIAERIIINRKQTCYNQKIGGTP